MLKKIQYNSPVVLSFFLLSLLSLFLGFISGGWTTDYIFSVYQAPLSDPLTYVRFFAHVLGHGNLEHFLSNMLLFLVVGPPLEEKYGSKLLLLCVVLTALVSGALHFVFFPDIALLGASGIVFMLIMLASLAGMDNGKIPLTLILVAALYLGQELYSILFIRDSVANFMHIVGGACGTFFGFHMKKHIKV